ncbi:unnamed protein product, partial [Brachionus calyciflorus]
MLMKKTQEFGKMLGINEQVFKYSIGWGTNFKRRNAIVLKTLVGEAGSVDLTLVERERVRLKALLEIDSQEPINNLTDREIFEMVTSIENLEDVDDSEKETEVTVRAVSDKEAIGCYEKLFSYFETYSTDSEKYETCNDMPMDFDNYYSSYSSNPMPDFLWMRKKSNVSYSFSDRECVLHDSIIIWDSTIYQECPLYNMGLEVFTIQQNSDVLISNGKLAVMACEPTSLCGLSLFLKPLDGRYLTYFLGDGSKITLYTTMGTIYK